MSHSPHALLLEPEGKQLEFKRDLSSPLNVLKTLVAFANSAGGRLVIGVDDVRQVVGVADPLAEEERICNRRRSNHHCAAANRVAARVTDRVAARVEARRHVACASASVGIRHRSVWGELHTQVRRLLDMARICMTRPDQPPSRLHRYRITPQGQTLLAALTTKEPPAP